MAYLPQDDEEKEGQGAQQGQIAAPQGETVQSTEIQQQKQSAQQENAVGGPVQLSEGSGDIQGASGDGSEAAEASQSGVDSGQGSGFTNITQYLQENAPQAQNLANRVGGIVQGQGNEASEAITGAQDSFNQDVQSNTVQYNQELANQAASQEFQGFQDQAQADEFRRMVNAQYQGPQNLESTDYYNPAAQSVQKAQSTAQLIDSDAGRKQLLSQIQQGKRANAGVTSLNNLLLSNSPEAKQILEQSRTGISDLDERLAQIAQQSGLDAEQAKALTAQTKQQIQNQFLSDQGVVNQFKTDVDARTQQAIQEAQAKQDAVKQAIAQNASLTDEQLNYLGVTKDQYNQLLADRNYYRDTFKKDNYNDLSRYITAQDPTQTLSRQNIATAEDYARNAALSDLLGINNDFLLDPSQAGTGSLDTFDLNLANAQGDISTARAGEEQRIAREAAERRAAEERARKAREAEAARNSVVAGAAIGAAVGGPAGAVVGGVIGGIVCFVEGTEFLMEDGDWKKIEDIKLGDYMAYGGMVLTHGKSFAVDLYEHNGVKVTGDHAVFEDDKWIPVKESKVAKRIDLKAPVIVYPIINEKHIMIPTNELIYSDLMGTDDKSLPDEERLKKMNSPENIDKTQVIEQQLELGRSWRQAQGKLKMVK